MPDRPVEKEVVGRIEVSDISNRLSTGGLNESQLEAVQMKANGIPNTKIAKYFDVSPTTVGNWIGKALRIETRKKREEGS